MVLSMESMIGMIYGSHDQGHSVFIACKLQKIAINQRRKEITLFPLDIYNYDIIFQPNAKKPGEGREKIQVKEVLSTQLQKDPFVPLYSGMQSRQTDCRDSVEMYPQGTLRVLRLFLSAADKVQDSVAFIMDHPHYISSEQAEQRGLNKCVKKPMKSGRN